MTMTMNFNLPNKPVIGGIYKHYENGDLVKILGLAYDGDPFGRYDFASLEEVEKSTKVVYKFIQTNEVYVISLDLFNGQVLKVYDKSKLNTSEGTNDFEHQKMFEYMGMSETPKCKCDLIELEITS